MDIAKRLTSCKMHWKVVVIIFDHNKFDTDSVRIASVRSPERALIYNWNKCSAFFFYKSHELFLLWVDCVSQSFSLNAILKRVLLLKGLLLKTVSGFMINSLSN